MAPTPATQGGPVPGVPVPDGALISDDNNSFISLDTESEGDFGLNHLLMVILSFTKALESEGDMELTFTV
jgi:hypothetical protein